MYNIEDITSGKSYACKFRLKDIPLDEFGRPGGMMSLADLPISKIGTYEGFGLLLQRDLEQRLVRVGDVDLKKDFIVSFDDIWDLDDVEWVD